MLPKKSRLNQMLSSKWQCASTPFLEGKKEKKRTSTLLAILLREREDGATSSFFRQIMDTHTTNNYSTLSFSEPACQPTRRPGGDYGPSLLQLARLPPLPGYLQDTAPPHQWSCPDLTCHSCLIPRSKLHLWT